MNILKKTYILFVAALIAAIGLTSCSVYRNSATGDIPIGALNLGMNKETVLAKLGQPFSFDVRVSENDTITVLSYKTPKVVANCEYVVTTELSFVNDRLGSITQRDFFVPEKVFLCDSTIIAPQGNIYKTK